MEPKELDELTGVSGEAEEIKAEEAAAETQEVETKIQLNDDVEKDHPVADPEKNDDSVAKTTEEKQSEVEAAQKQHEETGTWPEGTPQWVKNRVNKLTQQKYEREQTIKSKDEALKKYEQENLELKKRLAEVKDPEKTVGERPKIDNFETEDAYFEALVDWKHEVREAEKAKQTKQAGVEEIQTETRQAETQDVINFEERRQKTVSEGSKKYPDFMEKIASVPAELFNANVVDAFTTAENSEDVAYYLANDMVELERIAHLGGAKMAIEIGKISAKLDVKTETTTKPPPKKTNAPDPINPIKGGRVSTGQISDDSMEVLEKVLARK